MPVTDSASPVAVTQALPDKGPVGVIGGDERERRLILALARSGYAVLCAGRHLNREETAAGARVVATDVALASPVVIGPMAGVDAEGRVRSNPPHDGVRIDRGVLSAAPAGALWLMGALRGPLAGLVAGQGVQHINLAEHDELATLNAIPSAEGAIMMAMQESPHCLAGTDAVVVGFGRTAQTLAIMLRGLVRQVTVVARSRTARAKARAMGFQAAGMDELAQALGDAAYCFNTVPAMVISEAELARAGSQLLVIDLASPPGGTDFAAAKRYGVKALLAPGLPGILAPVTAGDFLTSVVLSLFEERGL